MRLLESPSPTWSSDSSEENEYGETTEKVESAFRSIDAPLGSKRRYGNDDGSLIKIKIPRIEWLTPANKASFDEPMYREYSFDPRSFGSIVPVSSSSYRDEMEVSMQTEQPSSGAGISVSDTRVELPQSDSPIASTEVESIAESRSSLSARDEMEVSKPIFELQTEQPSSGVSISASDNRVELPQSERPITPAEVESIAESRSDSDQVRQKNKTTLSRWTQEEKDGCIRMRIAGMTYEAIAAKLGRTMLAVKKKLSLFNEMRPEGEKFLSLHARWTKEETKTCQELRCKGATIQEIAVKTGRSFQAVQTQLLRSKRIRENPEMFRRGNRWTDEETRICLKMKQDGKSYVEIAERVGKSQIAVRRKLQRERGK